MVHSQQEHAGGSLWAFHLQDDIQDGVHHGIEATQQRADCDGLQTTTWAVTTSLSVSAVTPGNPQAAHPGSKLG